MPIKHFGKAAAIREMIRDHAQKIVEEYLDVAAKAKDAGDYETAQKALQWLMEHMPADEDGKTIVDVSVDKQKQIAAPQQTGPAIQIGIQVGGIGVTAQKALPQVTAEIIEAD